MGARLIFFGFLFLINPDFVTLDPIPDFIGYLLIWRGLYRLSFLEDRLESAKKCALLLSAVGVLKLLSNVLVFSSTMQSTRLTVSFFFFVAELWLGIFLVRNAMSGVQYLASRRDGEGALRGFETTRLYLLVFVVLKNLAAFLPQATVIFFSDVDADPNLVENFAQQLSSYRTTRNLLLILGTAIVIAFGATTARILYAYIKRCRADKAFVQNLQKDFDEKVTNNPSQLTRLAVKNAMLFSFAAFLFMGDLYLDHVDFFLHPLLGVLGFFALRALNGRVPAARKLSLVPLASAVLTLASWICRIVYLEKAFDFTSSFPASPLSAVFGLLGQISLLAASLAVLYGAKRCAELIAGVTFQKDFILLALLSLIVTGAGYIQYRYVGRSSAVVAVEWIAYILLVFFAQNAFDRVRRETEWKWM